MSDKSKDAQTLAAASNQANRATIQSAIATQGDKPKDTRSHEQILADSKTNRAELVATLDAIEYRINVPKRVGNRLRVLREENPAALAAIGVAGAAIVGVAIFVAARSLSSR